MTPPLPGMPASSSPYDWSRFWIPQTGILDLSDAGLLRDPVDSLYGPGPLRTLAQLEDYPALALLGEPGIGKSASLRQEHKRLGEWKKRGLSGGQSVRMSAEPPVENSGANDRDAVGSARRPAHALSLGHPCICDLVDAAFCPRRALVHGSEDDRGGRWGDGSGAAQGEGLGDPDHSIERRDGDGRLAMLRHEYAGTKPGADQLLVSADRGLDEVAPAVAGRLLPRHAALLGDEPDVAVARVQIVGAIGARHRGCARRDNHVRRRAVLASCRGSVDGLDIVCAVGRHAGDHAFGLCEQSRRLDRVIGVAFRQHVGSDLTRHGIHGHVQLAPLSVCPAVFRRIPFALTEQLQPRAVEHKVDRAVMPNGPRLATGKVATAPRQGGMVGRGQLEPEQAQHAAGECLGLRRAR